MDMGICYDMGLKCKRDKKVTVVDHSWVGHVIEYSLEHFEWFNTLDIKRKKVRYESPASYKIK